MNTSADTALKTWWGFRVAFVMNLYLAMCANVSSLIYGLRESSFFVGPGIVSPPERKKVGCVLVLRADSKNVRFEKSSQQHLYWQYR